MIEGLGAGILFSTCKTGGDFVVLFDGGDESLVALTDSSSSTGCSAVCPNADAIG